MRLTAAGVDSVGVAELAVGVGVADADADDGDGVALLGFALLEGAMLVAGACEGKRLPAWLRTTPARAKTTSRIRAISGQVHGLRLRRCGSSSGSSYSGSSSSCTQVRSAARASARFSALRAP